MIPFLKLSNAGVANYVIDIFIHREPIPYFIVAFFGLSIGFLLKHVMVLQFENYAFNILKNEIKESDELPTKCIYSDSLSFLKIVNNDNIENYKKTLIYKRIPQIMQHLFNSQDTNAMNEYYKQRSDIEYLEME